MIKFSFLSLSLFVLFSFSVFLGANAFLSTGLPKSTQAGTSLIQTRTRNEKKRNQLTMRVSPHNNGKFPGGNSILSQNVNNMNENDQPTVVYVANLPYAATAEEVEQFFSSCGPVVDVKIIRDQYTKRSKGYCFVKFAEAIHATVAIDQANGKDFMGRAITCRPAFRSGAYSSSRPADENDNLEPSYDNVEPNYDNEEDGNMDMEVEDDEDMDYEGEEN